MWRATCRECGREVPNGLKKKQLEALVEKDERDSRKMWNDKREKRGRGDRGPGSGGGFVDPRDAEVRALRRQLAEMQTKTSAKSPEAPPPSNSGSASPCDSEQLECTATIAEMAKMFADFESKMGPSHPASILLRTQLEEAKKERDGGNAAQNAPESCGVLDCEARPAAADHGSSGCALKWRSAAASGAHARCAGGAQAVGGHDGDGPSPGSCSSIGNGHRFQRRAEEAKDTLDGLLSKFESTVRPRRVKLTPRSCCCARVARKRSSGDRTWQFETVNITSGSRLQSRLEETAADVVLFQEHKWTAPRTPEQRSRISKKRCDVTLHCMPRGHHCHGRSKLGHVRGVWWPPQHPVKLQLVNAVLPGGLVVVSVYLTTAIGYSEQNIAFLNTLGQVLRAIDLPFKGGGDINLAGEVLEQSGWQYECALPRRAMTRRRAWTPQAKAKSSISSWCRRSCTPLSKLWQLTKDS